MRFLIVVKIKEGKFTSQCTFEKETFDDVMKAVNEFPYNWELIKVYQISGIVNL